jgi:hypothetical protein
VTEPKRRVTTESNTENALCPYIQQRLPDYLHFGLTAVEQQQIQAHLARCNSCAQRVQEARLLDVDLQAEADRHQPRLSREASLRIQHQVYRRMQRSLVWQRTGQIVRLGTAIATLLLLLVGSFLFGRFWLPNLANSTSEVGEATNLPEAPLPIPTAIPTAPPPIPEPNKPAIEVIGNGRINAWDSWVSVAPGLSPEQLAATIMDAALTRNEAFLNDLFVGMGAAQRPTAQLWLRIGNRCPQPLNATDFVFTRKPIPLPTVTAISIGYKDYQVGEIKMRQIAGDWFATFTRIPAVNPCLHQ